MWQGQSRSPESSTVHIILRELAVPSARISVLKRVQDCVSVTEDVVFSVYIRQSNLSIFGPLYFNPLAPELFF